VNLALLGQVVCQQKLARELEEDQLGVVAHDEVGLAVHGGELPHRSDENHPRHDRSVAREASSLTCRCHARECRNEDRIRDDKDTGLAKLPFKQFTMNEVWLEIVMLAHDLLLWTQALCLDGELAKAEPKRLRYRYADLAGMPASV
jgi:hypothetical protein